VLGDLVSVARHRVLGGRGPVESSYAALPVLPALAARTRFQVRLAVEDRPGVLAQVAAALAEHGVSIEAVRQVADPSPAAEDALALLLITTHAARESALAATVTALTGLASVREVVSVLRVEGA
jgi:homoserine dehydrogenase